VKKKIPFLVFLLVILIGAGWYASVHLRDRGPQPLRLYGNVDIREVNLGFRVAGRIQEVLKDEGDEARQGEILARLDAEPYQREVQQAKALANSLAAKVQLLEKGNRPQEIAQARAVLHEREVTATNAETLYRRQQDLFGSKAVSAQERDDAEARFREAAARLNSAREQLNLLEAGFRPEEIAQAKADLRRAEAALAGAELKVKDATLESPCDGVVLTRSQEPGAVLQAGTPVLTLSLKRPVWVRVYVSEPDLGRVHPGMKVRVQTDTVNDHAYWGQIGFISPRAEFTPKNVETTELRTSLVYRLRIVIENPDEGLRQGMPVTVAEPGIQKAVPQ
jgi:HlyD family secretion protein